MITELRYTGADMSGMRDSGVTRLLHEVSEGDRATFNHLIPLVQAELQRLARSGSAREQTLQPSPWLTERASNWFANATCSGTVGHFIGRRPTTEELSVFVGKVMRDCGNSEPWLQRKIS